MTLLRLKKNYTLEDLKKMWLAKINNKCVFISATEKYNIEEFKVYFTTVQNRYINNATHTTTFISNKIYG